MTLRIMKGCTGPLLLALSWAFLFNTGTVNADEDWFTLETEHFLIHYQAPAESLAQRTTRITEQVHDIVSKRLNWVPREKTHIVLTDSSDQANGYVVPFPYNRSVLFLSPPVTEASASLFDYEDWWTLLILHEYTHVVHLDKGHGFIASLRHGFGRVPLFFPNALNVPWVIEGLATHYETDDEAGVGRGQSTYFKMLMRAELASGFKPVEQINLPISSWPGGHSRYLYGVFFFRFLESRYGAGASERFVENYSDNFVPWRIGGILEQETGKDIDSLWREFDQWLRAELEFDAPPVTESRLTRHGNDTHGLSGSANGELYYLRQDRLAPPALMQMDAGGTARELAEVHVSANIDVHESGVAVVQPEICNDGENNLYYDFYLYRFARQKLERMTECERLVQISWHPDGQQLAAVQLDNAATRIVLVDADGTIGDVLWPAEEGINIAEIDWSPDGKSLVAARHHRGRGWNIERFDLASRRWQALTDDRFVQLNPRFSRDGQSVLFSSEASGRFQIHEIDVYSGRQRRLTDASLGAFSFAPLDEGKDIAYIGYTSDGFDLFRSARQDYPVSPVPAATSTVSRFGPAEAVAYQQSDYSPWSSLLPRWWLPTLGYTEESFELGFVTGGNDALGDHVYLLWSRL